MWHGDTYRIIIIRIVDIWLVHDTHRGATKVDSPKNCVRWDVCPKTGGSWGFRPLPHPPFT